MPLSAGEPSPRPAGHRGADPGGDRASAGDTPSGSRRDLHPVRRPASRSDLPPRIESSALFARRMVRRLGSPNSIAEGAVCALSPCDHSPACRRCRGRAAPARLRRRRRCGGANDRRRRVGLGVGFRIRIGHRGQRVGVEHRSLRKRFHRQLVVRVAASATRRRRQRPAPSARRHAAPRQRCRPAGRRARPATRLGTTGRRPS